MANAGFEPLAADDIRAAAERPSRRVRTPWLFAVAAVVVLVLAVTPLIVSQWGRQGVTAVPSARTPGQPTATAGTAPSWSPRWAAPVDVAPYAQVVVDDAVYLITAIDDGEGCRLAGYRYVVAPDLWDALPAGPRVVADDCATANAFASGSRIYVLTTAKSGAQRLYSYDTDTGTWANAPTPKQSATNCTPVALTFGIFCLYATPGSGETMLRFQWFDYQRRPWTTGQAQVGAQPWVSATAQQIRRNGTDQVLLAVQAANGAVDLAVWNAATGTLGQQFSNPGTGARLTAAQVTGDRVFYVSAFTVHYLVGTATSLAGCRAPVTTPTKPTCATLATGDYRGSRYRAKLTTSIGADQVYLASATGEPCGSGCAGRVAARAWPARRPDGSGCRFATPNSRWPRSPRPPACRPPIPSTGMGVPARCSRRLRRWPASRRWRWTPGGCCTSKTTTALRTAWFGRSGRSHSATP